MKWKDKKVIVTGGAGLIGRELIKKLFVKGALIKCFDITPRPEIFPKEIEYCQDDLSESNFSEFKKFNPDFIFHLAAIIEGNEKDVDFWEFNFSSNIFLSHKIISSAKECKNLKKFVFASSYLIYDPALYLSENSDNRPVRLREDFGTDPKNLYAASKYFTEKELAYLNDLKGSHKFSSVSARIFRVYGRGSGDVISRWVRFAIKGDLIKIMFSENSFDYIFSEDVAEGLLRLAESDNAEGVVNLGSGVSKSISEVVNVIGKQMPSFKKIEERGKKGLFEKSCADISRLKKFTGWEPKTTIKQGIKIITDYEIQKK